MVKAAVGHETYSKAYAAELTAMGQKKASRKIERAQDVSLGAVVLWDSVILTTLMALF